MTAAVTGDGRIQSLEGMRGAAILLVFIVHYVVAWTLVFPASLSSHSLTAVIADAAFSIGNSGVDLFMALSGYLIYDHFMRREQPLARYFGRRIRRIYPAYLVTVALYVGLMLADPAKSKLPGSDLDTILYIAGSASLLPGLFPLKPLVGVAWSLNYEIEFYLLLPLGVSLFRLRRLGFGGRVAVLVGLVGVLLLHAAIVGLHERVIMFVGGMLAREVLFKAGDSLPWPRLVETATVFLVVTTFSFIATVGGSAPYTYPDPGPALLRAILLVVVYGMLLAVTVGVAGVGRSVFEAKWLRLLGTISFSFYLLHNLALRIAVPMLAAHVTPDMADWMFWVAISPAFALCLIAGMALYWLIERPVSLRPPTQRLAARSVLSVDAAVTQNR